MSFNEQFDQDGAWRLEFAGRLKLLAVWMEKQGLLNVAVEQRLRRLETQVRSDKVMVAFVGEFSRGKSELINAIFFAGYGHRVMPASAGRTTMCPTELSYDSGFAPSLRLLPIETRLEPHALMDWRLIPEKWRQIDLDAGDADQLAAAMQKVTEVQYVPVENARALGFWDDTGPGDNPAVAPGALVQIPRWRHALINIAHPLLKQGLVILDTPGFNAIGAEPELTISLIPQAHAVLFILWAETGVTQSDLAIWDEHLGHRAKDGKGGQTRLVVLNKIDTLWDDLSTPAQVQTQIDRQKASSANLLDLPESQIVAVSAQKGLVAKITNDEVLLQASQLPALEQLLGQCIMGQRQKILRTAVTAGVTELKSEASRILYVRRRNLAEQILELRGLRGKNSGVVSHMQKRVALEQAEFVSGSARIHAVRSVHHTLLAQAVDLLSVSALKAELAELLDVLKQPGIKLRLKKIYGQTFFQLRERLDKGQTLAAEIKIMLDSAFQQINAEFGFSLQAAQVPDLARHVHDLDLVERSHLQYLGLGNVIRLAQADFSDRLVRALSSRLRVVFELALDEMEQWSKAASAQLDAQVRERRQNLARRLEAIERIQQAASTLNERIAELASQEIMQKAVEVKLADLTIRLSDFQPAVVAASPPYVDPVIFASAAASA